MDLSKLQDDASVDSAFKQMPERCVVILEDVDCMDVSVRSRPQRSAALCSITKPNRRRLSKNYANDALIRNIVTQFSLYNA